LPPNWGVIRAAVIARDPVCRWGSLDSDMAEPGRCPDRSTDADHIGDPNDHSLEVLRGLCQRHHQVRTGRQGAAGRVAVQRTRKRPQEPHPGFKR
jgi:5-methylcytosine-specific restriction enzyme A